MGSIPTLLSDYFFLIDSARIPLGCGKGNRIRALVVRVGSVYQHTAAHLVMNLESILREFIQRDTLRIYSLITPRIGRACSYHPRRRLLLSIYAHARSYNGPEYAYRYTIHHAIPPVISQRLLQI